MENKKNWLIRTQDFQILGPVSRQKVMELLKNGSLRPVDEVCSGNGYWFYIKEKELVERYIMEGQEQEFNPISEAKDVLTLNMGNDAISPEAHLKNYSKNSPETRPIAKNDGQDKNRDQVQKVMGDEGEEVLIPSPSDLEYPDQEEEKDFTMVASLNDLRTELNDNGKGKLKAAAEELSTDPPAFKFGHEDHMSKGATNGPLKKKMTAEPIKVKENVQEINRDRKAGDGKEKGKEKERVKEEKPLEGVNGVDGVEEVEEVEEKEDIERAILVRPLNKKGENPPKKNDRYLGLLFFIFLALLIGITIYRKAIVKEIFSRNYHFPIILDTFALSDFENVNNEEKKKVLISPI